MLSSLGDDIESLDKHILHLISRAQSHDESSVIRSDKESK